MKIRLFNPIVFIFIMILGLLQFSLYDTFDIATLIYVILWFFAGMCASGMFSFLEFTDEYMEVYGIPNFKYQGEKTIMYEDIKDISGKHMYNFHSSGLSNLINKDWIVISNNNDLCIGKFQIIFFSEKLMKRVVVEILNHCSGISVKQEIDTFIKTSHHNFK